MSRTRLTPKEQYQRVMECRQSGLSDYQWCQQNNVKPSTFYTWIKRLREKGVSDIPEPARRNTYTPMPEQEVVRIDFTAPGMSTPNYAEAVPYPSNGIPSQSSAISPTIKRSGKCDKRFSSP